MSSSDATCLEVARNRLADRPLKDYTVRNYMQTLRLLGLEHVPFREVSVSSLHSRLQAVLNQNTRRKMAIDLRASLGIAVPCPKPLAKQYDLPPLDVLHNALENSPYAMWGYVMLYAGLRIGEACVTQSLTGRVLTVDRQRCLDGVVRSSKTSGPVMLPEWLADLYPSHDFDAKHDTVSKNIKRAGQRAGFHLTSHVLRHAFATHLVNIGASPEVLRRQMRHHDVCVSIQYYVQTTQADIARVMEGFGGPCASSQAMEVDGASPGPSPMAGDGTGHDGPTTQQYAD